MGGKVSEMKLDRLSGILRGLFKGASVRNATRKRRDQDRVTPRLFGNQADLIGKQFLLFAHASIMPAPKRIARGNRRESVRCSGGRRPGLSKLRSTRRAPICGSALAWLAKLDSPARRLPRQNGLARQVQASGILTALCRQLQEWEQGRRRPESAVRAYLTVMNRNPEAVAKALITRREMRRVAQALLPVARADAFHA